MRPGDRVLVHAAAGGVGLAAIQVVQAKGATVVATAGGTSKRSLLHSLGVRHVLGSRDTAFVSEAAELGGASVVLNSLTSSGMVAGSLAALGAGGRFVEISKRDIWSAARVAQGELELWAASTCDCAWLLVRQTSSATATPQTSASPTRPILQSAPTCATAWWPSTSCRRPSSAPLSARWPRAWRPASCARCARSRTPWAAPPPPSAR